MNAPKNTAAESPSTGYSNLVDLMSIHSEATSRIAELENDLQQAWLDLVDARRADYSKLQEAVATTAEGIEMIARLNPQWFTDAKTLKTPYGSVAFRTTTKLEVKNEEVTILLIQQMGVDGDIFLRQKTELNLDALAHLDDADLKPLRVKRVTAESCTVKPSKVDLGKAVKAAAQKAS
jgi:hypothetical protein